LQRAAADTVGIAEGGKIALSLSPHSCSESLACHSGGATRCSGDCCEVSGRLRGGLHPLEAPSLGAAVIAAERDEELAHRLEAVVHVHAEVPPEARTAAYLGTARDGSGVVIDDAGLIVTIGYLITEAMGAEITTADGKISRADVVGVDLVSGLGLLRAAEVLPVKPMPIGRMSS